MKQTLQSASFHGRKGPALRLHSYCILDYAQFN